MINKVLGNHRVAIAGGGIEPLYPYENIIQAAWAGQFGNYNFLFFLPLLWYKW